MKSYMEIILLLLLVINVYIPTNNIACYFSISITIVTSIYLCNKYIDRYIEM